MFAADCPHPVLSWIPRSSISQPTFVTTNKQSGNLTIPIMNVFMSSHFCSHSYTMMRTFSIYFIIFKVFTFTNSIDYQAWSFVPVTNNSKKPCYHYRPSKPFSKTIVIHSSSSAEDTETASFNDIIGPELPPLDGSAKRLFLVRHGEVINPGK